MRVPVRFSGVFLAVLACVPLGACQLLDKVEEDRRTEYLKSRTLPDLEIPPDLVAADSGEPLVIPGEVPGEEPAGPEQTAGEALPVQEEAPEQAAGEAPPVQEEAPEQAAGEAPPVQEETPEQAGRQDAGEDAAAAEASESEPAATEPAEAESQFAAVAGRRPVPSPPLEPGLPPPRRDTVLNEQLVKVQGEWKEVWPLLRKFWGSKGLALDLEDLSLGVMETVWTVPYLQQDMTVRNRFKLFLEPGPEEGILHVVLSSEKEVYLEQEGSQEGDWLLQDPDLLLEKKYASELQGFLGEHL
ncbi:MAG: hypothetical protein OXU43_06860 [Gammaproteobacteria bacterium]|nr:hypothetical protein [Gammaproteobacteria bacterium]